MVIGCYSMEVRPYLSKSALIVCDPDKVQERPKENDKEYLYIYNSFLNKNTLKESKEPQSTIVQQFLAHLSHRIKWGLSVVCRCIFIFFSRTTRPISFKLRTKHYLAKGIQVCQNKGPYPP